MKIITKYILNSIRERKLRAAVMLLSIMLSATLLIVSFGIGASYESAQRKMAIGYAGAAGAAVRPSGDSGENLIDKEVLAGTAGVKHVAGVIKARALYQQDGYYENFDIIAASAADLEAFNPPRVRSGDLSEFSGRQIAVPDRFADKFGTAVGDLVPVTINGREYQFQVAAICAYDTVFLRNSRGYNVLIPAPTMTEIVAAGSGYSELLVVPEEGLKAAELTEQLRRQPGLEQYDVAAVYNEAAVAAGARQKSMPFYLISFFTMTISAFIIYSSYKIITAERLPVLGTFRSIGATGRMVTGILLAESLIYGIGGSLLGIPAGFAVLKLLLSGMAEGAAGGIAIPLVIPPGYIALAIAAAVLVSVLGAYLPVKKAAGLPVKELVLGTVAGKPGSNTITLLAGLALFVISIILPRLLSGSLLTAAGGLSLLTLIAGAILVVPLLLRVMSAVLEPVYGRLFGNVGRLAARNLRGNRNTSQNTTLLFISISAIIVIRVVSSFVNVYITDVFRGAALDGFSSVQVDEHFIDEVRAMEGVSQVLPLQVLDDHVRVNGQSLRVEATVDIEAFREMLAIHYTAGDPQQIAARFSRDRSVILSDDAAASLGVQPGDTVKLSGAQGTYDYIVCGSFKSRADDVAAVLPSDRAMADFGVRDYGFFAYRAADPESVMNRIRDRLGEQQHWSRTVKEFTDDAVETVSAFLEPMNKLTYFILLLATVGVINNLLINFIQKKRSIAMYKSVGLSNGQNIVMTLLEAFSVGLAGAGLGMFVSWLEIKTVFLVAGPKISMVPELSPEVFLIAGGLGIAITLIGSLVPISRSMNMKIVTEIRFE